MKKVLSVFVMFLLFIGAYAQDLSEALQAKNDGNDAYRNKDYVSAIANWEKYLNSDEEGAKADENTKGLYLKSFLYAANSFMKAKDYPKAYDYFQKYLDKNEVDGSDLGQTVYTMAYCANKMDKNDLALSHYQKAVELNYKPDASTFYIASIYKDIDNEEKMKETLLAGIEKYPDSKIRSKMVALLTIPLLRDAAVPFNDANELAKSAQSSDANAYLQNMSKAVAKFEEAIPLFNDVLKYDPTNEQATTYLKACNDNITSFNEYKTNLEKK